ncbi:MAG TPA: hypothetical protein VGG75_33445 [Trebonia sp.]|jgi:hypothetical protein
MQQRWADLERRRAGEVWSAAQHTFNARISGPHFEALCRLYTLLHGAALALPAPDEPRRIVSLGEAKWGEVMGIAHLHRLERAAALLATRKFDTRDTILACYSAAGFDDDLRDRAARDPRLRLIGPEDLYADR